ncbi:MAG: DUF885 domain-containing protein [Thermoanaerobaculia bacterium]
MKRLPVLCSTVLALAVLGSPALHAEEDWVARSDRNTDEVTELFGRYVPELIGQLGAEGLDEEVTRLGVEVDERLAGEERELLAVLRERRSGEADARVAQDLDILIDLLDRELRLDAAQRAALLPYEDVTETVFRGLRALLDDQVPEERRAAALVRLRRYAGLEEGYAPLTEQAEAYTRSGLDDSALLGPFREEVENDLDRGDRLVAGIADLFREYELDGWEPAYETLRGQLEAYAAFVRSTVLPRTREDYRLPGELYALQLEDYGVDLDLDELVRRAKVSFREIQNEMQALARLLAEERGLPSADYRDVLRVLQGEQLVGEEILTYYTDRIADVEAIIERERIATLPARPLRLRIASDAESAVVQAATIRWPQLLGDGAEVGEIILPLVRPATGDAEEDRGLTDFTSKAAAWSLVVHEGRPGHELQMASILEGGISKARAFYAFNSTNVEGWALYAESEMKPYLPLDAQLVSLQHRLLRAARAILDPGLQRGEITREQAMRVLTEEVVFSQPMAEQEVERYTSRSPGQAVSYFCGYSRLLEIRADAERILGERFDRRAFNDFVLSQGLVPPRLLRRAVMEELVR